MSVEQTDSGLWDYQCDAPPGLCGADGVPFRSVGWPSKKTATERGAQHDAEHAGRTLMQTLDDFIAERGITVKGA